MKVLTSASFASLRLVAVCIVLGSSGFAQSGIKANKSVPPKGTFTRPSDAIRHPQLDEAWLQYRTAVARAVDDFTAALDRQVEAATTKGDPDAVRLSRAWRTTFEEQGVLPAADRSMQGHVHAAGRALRLANEKLLDAYGKLVRTLTQEKKEAEERAVSEERARLKAGLAFPPISNVPWPLFDGKDWLGWGVGWGQGRHDVIADDKAIRLTGFRCFAHEQVLTRAYTFELEARNRAWQAPGSAFQFGIQEIDGCMVRIPARNQAGEVVPGKAEVIHWNNANQQTNSLVTFDCPLPVGANKWHKCKFSWGGGRYSVVIDGKKVVDNQPLPFPMQRGFNLHIGVGGGAADVKNLELTEDTPPP